MDGYILEEICRIVFLGILYTAKHLNVQKSENGKKEELGLVGAEWIDEAKGIYLLDLKQFKSDFYVSSDMLAKFIQQSKYICKTI